jgi:hypothetical protein
MAALSALSHPDRVRKLTLSFYRFNDNEYLAILSEVDKDSEPVLEPPHRYRRLRPEGRRAFHQVLTLPQVEVQQNSSSCAESSFYSPAIFMFEICMIRT